MHAGTTYRSLLRKVSGNYLAIGDDIFRAQWLLSGTCRFDVFIRVPALDVIYVMYVLIKGERHGGVFVLGSFYGEDREDQT